MESNEALYDTDIDQMIHGLDLPLSFSTEPLCCAVLRTTRSVVNEYCTPARYVVEVTLLNANYDTVRRSNNKKLLGNSNIIGLQAMGNGATIRKIPLFNVLASTPGAAPVVLVVHDCSKPLAAGGKKDAEYVAKICLPWKNWIPRRTSSICTLLMGLQTFRVLGMLLCRTSLLSPLFMD
jgi:hypothetical protein